MKHLLALSVALVTLAWSPTLLSEKDSSLSDLLHAGSIWTREYLIAVSNNLPDQATQAAEKKLLDHQIKLGNALQPFYSTKGTQEVGDLFKQQGMLTVELINAVKKADPQLVNEKKLALTQNATAISSQLSKGNPYITFSLIRNMLYDYLALMTSMITDRIQTKWQEDLENYDKVRTQNSEIASYIAQAIKNAFPQKFSEIPTNVAPRPHQAVSPTTLS